jgi:hypothetical protein
MGNWVPSMSNTPGVAVNELYCPTCGEQFTDLHLYSHSDSEDFNVDAMQRDIIARPRVPWFMLCPNRHKWSVKLVYRIANRPDLPDRVQLDRYLGGGPA